MAKNNFTLYLKPEERARLGALGYTLQQLGYNVVGPNGTPAKAAMVRALMQYLYDNLPSDEQRRVDETAVAAAKMYAETRRGTRSAKRGTGDEEG